MSSLKSYERAASGLAKDQAVLLLPKRKGQAIYFTLLPNLFVWTKLPYITAPTSSDKTSYPQ